MSLIPARFHKYDYAITYLKDNIDKTKDFCKKFCQTIMDTIYYHCINYSKGHESHNALIDILSRSSDTRLITPRIYKLLLLTEQYEFIFEYERKNNYDIVASYEHFDVLSYIIICPVPADFKYFENALLAHKDYFLRSLQWKPKQWIIESNLLYYIQNKEIYRFIRNNIGYDKAIVDHSEYWLKSVFDYTYRVRYIPYIVHHSFLRVDLGYSELGEVTILEYFEMLHTKFDEIRLRIDDNLPGGINEQFKNSMITLVRKEKILKQAKNYYPPAYNDIANFDDNLTQKDIEFVRLIKLWKLNLVRMFVFRNNLDTLCFVEFEKLK